VQPHVGMAGLTGVAAYKPGTRGRRRRLVLGGGRGRHQQQQQCAHLLSNGNLTATRLRSPRVTYFPHDSEGPAPQNRLPNRIYVTFANRIHASSRRPSTAKTPPIQQEGVVAAPPQVVQIDGGSPAWRRPAGRTSGSQEKLPGVPKPQSRNEDQATPLGERLECFRGVSYERFFLRTSAAGAFARNVFSSRYTGRNGNFVLVVLASPFDSIAHRVFCLLAPDSLDSHIPQGYQGRSPWLVGFPDFVDKDAVFHLADLDLNHLRGFPPADGKFIGHYAGADLEMLFQIGA